MDNTWLSNTWAFLSNSTNQTKSTDPRLIGTKKKTFKLSIATEFYPPDYAATGQLIEELAIQLGKQGMQIHIFTGQPGYAFNGTKAPALEDVNPLLIRRSKISRIWPQRIRGKAISGILFCLRSALHLFKHYSRGDVLLLTTAPPFLGIIGYLAKLCFGMPYVCLLYDVYPDAAVALKTISEKHWLVKFWDEINRIVWQEAKSIIAISPTMKDRIVAKNPKLADKISVIHNWANPNDIRPIPKEKNWFARQHKITDKFTVLYSGNLGRCHDMETIMTAAKLLQNEQVQFIFIGKGAKLQVCRDIVSTQGLHNCLFLPYQDKQVLPYSLASCDLGLVSIAPDLEGIVAPSKLYGILASGRPIAAICEPHSYLRQLIEDSGCGAAFNNNDANGLAEFIRYLYLNPQKRDKMGKAARDYLLSNFTPEIISQKYLKVLKSDLTKGEV
ncbi:MAG: glycosyltransferase family 4 protein [Xenococcaceae cyanobacterium]